MRKHSLLTVGLLALFLAPAAAHTLSFTEVEARLAADGTFRVDMRVDLDALALGVSSTTDSEQVVGALNGLDADGFEAAVERARDTLERRVRVRFDGEMVAADLDFPEYENPSPTTPQPTVLGVIARFSGKVPEGAKEFVFRASRAFPPVQLTVIDEASGRSERWPLAPGEDSPAFALGGPATPQSRIGVAWRYLVLGYEHILPRGLDHILFVLGLFLLSRRLGPLLMQVTAFTVAHTLTLGLSMYGVVALSSRVVEPLIAASIAYVAIENVFTTELKPWRPLLVFGFGLLHGLGFAAVLHELGLPEGEMLTALFSFNVGVEAGQLSVILLAFAAVGWFRSRAWYRVAITVPASVLIALVGLYWAVERTLG